MEISLELVSFFVLLFKKERMMNYGNCKNGKPHN